MKPDVDFGLATAGWPAFLVDAAGVICRANTKATRIFGAALQGASPRLTAIWSTENPGGGAEAFLAQWARSEPPVTPLKFRLPDGTNLACQTAISRLGAEGRDLLLWQLLPEVPAPAGATAGDLAQKQKLDCALQLARTVALDFNNALTSILGHTSLMLGKMEPTHPWRPSLLEVEKSAARAAEIASDLGTFSRQEKEARTQTAGNLNLLLQRAVEFLQQNTGATAAEWSLQLERQLYAAKFDEAKMQQAFIKILENAIESLPGRGRVDLVTRNVDVAQPTQDRNVRLAPGSYICAEISDTGCGIAPEVLPRIFEPFFTTKRGSHRGLGLAWVYGIVTNHGGGVAVSSEPDAGTSVRVYLPAETRVVRDAALKADELTGNETILLVDDEDLLLTMGRTILSSYGYQVLTANSGAKALEILAGKKDQVALVITDLVMPAMSGRELVEQIRRLYGGLKVLCTSGYVWPASQEQEGAYLQKPFTAQGLLKKVKQLLAKE